MTGLVREQTILYPYVEKIRSDDRTNYKTESSDQSPAQKLTTQLPSSLQCFGLLWVSCKPFLRTLLTWWSVDVQVTYKGCCSDCKMNRSCCAYSKVTTFVSGLLEESCYKRTKHLKAAASAVRIQGETMRRGWGVIRDCDKTNRVCVTS